MRPALAGEPGRAVGAGRRHLEPAQPAGPAPARIDRAYQAVEPGGRARAVRCADGFGGGQPAALDDGRKLVVTAIVIINAEVDRIPEVAEAIAALDGVSEVYSVTGEST